jgi:membrane associated rhomboid family serine protease
VSDPPGAGPGPGERGPAAPGPSVPVGADDWRCYRHPDREGGVRCRRCERPICPDCMVQAPVGFQCPTCVRAGPPGPRPLRALRREPYVTWAIIAACVLVFLPSLGGGAAIAGRGDLDVAGELALNAPAVASGEWWRLFSSGFVHYGLLHIGFNMFVLFQLGTLLEPALGRLRFAALYATALLGGAVGALLLDPNALTAGASGAGYGLMGAAVLGLRRRGVDPFRTGRGGLLVINLLLTFIIPGISVGGHLGGLAAGAVAGWTLFATEDTARDRTLGTAAVAAVGVALLITGLWVAANPVG